MKRYPTLVITILLVLSFGLPVSINAQKKVTKKVPPKRRPTPTPTPTPAIDMHPEANKVALQINNITLFLYKYGKIVNGLELAEDQAKRGQATPALTTQNKANRDALVNNFRTLRAGLIGLMKEFQTNPRYQVQYLKISYATEAMANAEQFASAGRYDEAGNSLVKSIERLTDTVISMRLP